MKDNDSAFPDCMGNGGMTLRQYAAIKLKVPRSGDPDIDAMIRESRRADFAERALTSLAGDVIWGHQLDYERAANVAYGLADAMLAKWEKEAGK